MNTIENDENSSSDSIIHSSIIRHQRTLVSAMAGVGKTSFVLSYFLAEYKRLKEQDTNRNIKFLFIDADDKSANQKLKFNEFMKSIDGHYLNYNDNALKYEAEDFTDFVLKVGNKLKDDTYYYLLVDNLTKILGSYENSNEQTEVTLALLLKSFMGKDNVNTTFIAHSGYARMGARGASNINSSFGEEIYIKKDSDLNERRAIILKDSERLHDSTNVYEIMTSTNEELDNYIINIKELAKELIVNDLVAYKLRRLEDIVASLALYCLEGFEDTSIIVAEDKFSAAVYEIGRVGSEGVIHPDSENFLSVKDIGPNLSATFKSLEITISNNSDYNTKVLDFSQMKFLLEKIKGNKRFTTVFIGEEAKKIIDRGILDRITYKQLEGNGSRLDMLKEELLRLLEDTTQLATEELRVATYKGKDADPIGYSKNYAKENITRALKELIVEGKIEAIKEGRKTIYRSK